MDRRYFPRNKEDLLREVDVRIKLDDIRRLHHLKDRLSPRWWEPVMIVILFAAALGLLASLFQYSDLRDTPLNKWMLFWFGLMILTQVFCFQVILIKIYNFRRAQDHLMRMVEEMRHEVDALKQAGDSSAEEK